MPSSCVFGKHHVSEKKTYANGPPYLYVEFNSHIYLYIYFIVIKALVLPP